MFTDPIFSEGFEFTVLKYTVPTLQCCRSNNRIELDPKNAAAEQAAYARGFFAHELTRGLPRQKFAGIGIHQRLLDCLLFSSNYFSETQLGEKNSYFHAPAFSRNIYL